MMKCNPLLFLLVIITSSAAGQSKFSLKLKTGQEQKTGMVYLSYKYRYQKVIDSAILKDSKASFFGKINGPALAQLYFKPQEKNQVEKLTELESAIFYLENGKNVFHANKSFSKGRVKHSALNREFEVYTAFLADVHGEVEKARSVPSYNLAQRKANDKKISEVMEEKRERLYQYVKQHPQSYFSIVALDEIIMSRMDMDRIESNYNSLSKKVKKSRDGEALGNFIEKEQRTKVGTMAMDFTQNDVNGVPIKLSDFRGKYVLIDFWASWCGPCRVENPHLVKAYEEFKDKNFTILGVSLDNPGDKQKWLDAIEKDGLHWPQVSDLQGWENHAAVLYGVTGVPASFLVDPNGRIIAKRLRGKQVSEKLKEVLD